MTLRGNVQKMFFGKEADWKHCIKCGKLADKFKDEISRKEFYISCLCQECQDEMFKEDEE
jgi:hypothetical protein